MLTDREWLRAFAEDLEMAHRYPDTTVHISNALVEDIVERLRQIAERIAEKSECAY